MESTREPFAGSSTPIFQAEATNRERCSGRALIGVTVPTPLTLLGQSNENVEIPAPKYGWSESDSDHRSEHNRGERDGHGPLPQNFGDLRN
jgi:hypothetical protein